MYFSERAVSYPINIKKVEIFEVIMAFVIFDLARESWIALLSFFLSPSSCSPRLESDGDDLTLNP